jgi:hypothetical protein
MIGQTISRYPGTNRRDAPPANQISQRRAGKERQKIFKKLDIHLVEKVIQVKESSL